MLPIHDCNYKKKDNPMPFPFSEQANYFGIKNATIFRVRNSSETKSLLKREMKTVLEKITVFQFSVSNKNLKIGLTTASSQYLRF